ncbi:MAG: hemolysin D [Candidatus Kapaibacterium sp.]|nr:MAG: hemolysin D [Candidatus Kapabacteria bacterium]
MKRLLLLALAAFACNRSAQTPSTGTLSDSTQTFVALTPEQQRTSRIAVDSLRSGLLERTIELRGTIELPPQNRIYLSFPLQARVRSINGLVGRAVRRGEALVTLESMPLLELQERYLSTRAQLEQAQREYERQMKLAPSAATTERALLEARTLLRERQIALAALAERLRIAGIEPTRLADTAISRTVVLTAPRDGYIAAINVVIGQSVEPNTRIIELVDVGDVYLVLRAYERDAPLIQPGQRLVAWTVADSSRSYPAEVVAVSHALDSTRTLELHCHFVRYDHERLRPGMFMRARLSVASEGGYLVPQSAVVAWENKHGVFVPVGNGFRLVEVRLVASDGNRAIIAFDRGNPPRVIVTQGAYWLLMKLKNTDQQEEV